MFERGMKLFLKYKEVYLEVQYLGIIARSDGTIFHVVEEDPEKVYVTSEKNLSKEPGPALTLRAVPTKKRKPQLELKAAKY